jgi:hypothetical protein
MDPVLLEPGPEVELLERLDGWIRPIRDKEKTTCVPDGMGLL